MVEAGLAGPDSVGRGRRLSTSLSCMGGQNHPNENSSINRLSAIESPAMPDGLATKDGGLLGCDFASFVRNTRATERIDA
jgi:hypothetical protein